MKKITLQDIFNAAWQAFVIENKPPAVEHDDDGWHCRYLTPGGCKCAVGLCIPDGHPAQQSKAPLGMLTIDYPELFDCPGTTRRLNRFQSRLHDYLVTNDGTWRPDVNIKREYQGVAKEYGLTIPGESQ